MIQTVNAVTNKDGISVHLFQNLNCSNFGIYAAQCTICNQLYIGQTKNKFSVKWTAHRSFRNNKFSEYNNTDQAALLKHCHNYHYSTHENKPKISDCFNVIFLEEPQNTNRLDICESRWIHKLRQKLILNRLFYPFTAESRPIFIFCIFVFIYESFRLCTRYYLSHLPRFFYVIFIVFRRL